MAELAEIVGQSCWEFTDTEAGRKNLSNFWLLLQNHCLVENLKVERPGYC